MDTDPKLTRKDAVRRAEHLAEEHLPSWLRAANPEGRLPLLCALITAIALQLAIPVRYTLAPRWPLITMEVLLLVVLVILNRGRLTRSTQLGRYTSWALLAAITIDKHGLGGAAELPDRGRPGEQQRRGAAGQPRGDLHHQHHRVRHLVLGAGQRRSVHPAYPQAPVPGLHVPTDGQSRTRAPNWAPNFLDYLYVSVTNVMAFSPTDTMPLARSAKMMMTLQAMVAVSTVLLVIARAVNVFR
jgi:hypothetical protein